MKKHFLTALAVLALIIMGSAIAIEGNAEKSEQIVATLEKTMTVQNQGEDVILTNGMGERIYPISYNGTVYLPAESIGDSLNAATEWDKEKNIFHIGGDATTTIGGIPEALKNEEIRDMTCVLLDVDKVAERTRVEAVSLIMNDDEATINVGGRQKYLLCFFGNQSGAAYHAVISNMDTGETILELDNPEGAPGEYQTIEIPVENVSRIKITGKLNEEMEP